MPHVDGQFAAYVYVPVLLSRKSKLYKLLFRIYSRAKLMVPILHPIGILDSESENDDGDGAVELHVSLTRPTYLRAHQREPFKRAVKDTAKRRDS